MSLEAYRRKRRFDETPEPAGGALDAPPPEGRRFVVQRHRATRLHYDVRLEIDGVLVSWAVPRGPSLDPSARRMAVHVEDHPLEYFDFEGVIPRGQYGAGDVIVWDWGTFEPEERADPGTALRNGELKFRLNGQKLRGRFTIVRTSGRGAAGRDEGKDEWLLIHKRDETSQPGWDAEGHPASVKSGRTNDDVKEGRPMVWDSSAPAAEAAIDLTGATESPMPEFIAPMRATAVVDAFSDEDWLFELKMDGYRVEAVIRGGRVRLWTRNKQDGARYFPDLAELSPRWIEATEAIVDGEVVALGPEGRPDFSLLQDRTGMRGFASKRGERKRRGAAPADAGAPLVYYVFDLLYHDGRLLLEVPLQERKRLLRSIVSDGNAVRYLSHIETDGEAFLAAAREQGLEGIIAKLRRSRYEPDRRARTWLKVKIRHEQELVVAGYEPGQGSHSDIGSLIVATYEKGQLVFRGQVGSGIDTRTRRELVRRLDESRVDESPFPDPPPIRAARWSRPSIVIRAEFADWTSDGLLRQASYKGEELGRDPISVAREEVIAAAGIVPTAEREAIPAPGPSPGPGSPAARSEAPAVRGLDYPASAPVGPSADDPLPLVRDPSKVGDPPQALTAGELRALDGLGGEGIWQVGGHDVKLSNLDKILFPEAGLTKRDLIRYYTTIAPVLLPYLRDRPLNRDRWPDGVAGSDFWEKQIPKHAPAWVVRWDYPEAGSTESHTYVVADRVATLAWLANMASIDLHAWTSRCASYRSPTYALIDIDPGEKTTFQQVVAFARLYRAALEHLGVEGFPKLTGKRGIQIWVPVRRGYTFDETRDWVGRLSSAVGRAMPDLVSWEWEKSARQGRARLDFTQNAVNKTLVAPYAVRPVRHAAVSAPIAWDELDDPDLRPDRWDIRTVIERVEALGDLFRPVLALEQELPTL